MLVSVIVSQSVDFYTMDSGAPFFLFSYMNNVVGEWELMNGLQIDTLSTLY